VLFCGPLPPFEIDPRFAEAITSLMDCAEPAQTPAPAPVKDSYIDPRFAEASERVLDTADRGADPLSSDFLVKSTAPELEQAALFYGMYSRLARKLRVTPQHVRQVAKGIHRSRRVEAAINREIQRIRSKTPERAA
jgi:hypothetical protein